MQLQAFIFLILMLSSVLLSGQSKTFNHSVDNHWNEANNWTPSGIPGLGDTVIIPSGTAEIPAGFTAYAECVSVEMGAQLTIFNNLNPGSLNIHHAKGDALCNQGTISNNGNIHIWDAAKTGVRNEGNFTNSGKAELIIDSTMEYGMINVDSLLNNGLIDIRMVLSPSWEGLVTSGLMRNKGSIRIDSVGNAGLKVSGGNAHFINDDTLEILHYNLLAGFGNDGIEVEDGLFTNDTSGYILIETGISGGYGINCHTAIFQNYGSMIIRDVLGYGMRIAQDGLVQNEGNIEIDDVSLGGLLLEITGAFIQEAGATFSVSNIVGTPLEVEEAAILEVEGDWSIN